MKEQFKIRQSSILNKDKSMISVKAKNQIMMSHPMLQHQTTSKVLELIHMNVTGPLQIDNLGGKSMSLWL